MIIERLDLKAYGRFSDQTLDLSAGPRRFHLVYGPNESGKSTCLRAISSLLFGIPNRTVDNFLHGNAKLRVGATLLDDRGSRLSVIRRKNGKTKLHAEDDKTPIDPSQLEQMMGGIDEDAFHHRFGLSHEQLVAGGQAILESKGELGEILFAAGAGVGRLKAIQAELENQGKELFLERGKKTINALLKEIAEKRIELRELQTLPAEYQSLQSKLAAAENQSRSLAESRSTANRTLAKCKAYREARQIVPIWKLEKQRLVELASVPTLDEEFVARRREASVNRKTYQKLVGDLKREIDEAVKQIESCPVEQSTLEHESEIVALFQSIATREAASRDQENLERVVKNKNRHLIELLRDLEIDLDNGAAPSEIDRVVQSLHVSDAAQIQIMELAGDCEMLRQQERDSLESLQTLRKQLNELDDEIERHPDAGNPAMIEAVLTEIGAPSALMDQADQEHATCRDLQQQCERLLGTLRLAELSLSDAAKLQTPTSGEIDDHDQCLNDRRREVQDAVKSLAQLQKQIHDAAEKLSKLQQTQRLPTEDELLESRRQRDRSVDQFDAIHGNVESLPAVTNAVRTSIRVADELADTIRDHQEQVTQRASASAELTRLEGELDDAQQAVAEARVGEAEAQAKWNELWQSRGIHAGRAREMRDWISTHLSLIEKHASLEKSRVRLETARNRIDRTASRLAAALKNAWSARPIAAGHAESLPASISEMSLESLHDCASTLRNDLVAAASHAGHLIRKRNEIHDAIPVAEAKYEANVSKRQQWDEQWEQAVATLAGNQQTSPSVISTRLKKVARLFEESRERDIVVGRIRSMEDDNQSFAQRVDVMAKLVGLQSGDNQTGDQSRSEIAQSLYQRLQSAKAAATQHERLQHEIAQRKERLIADTEMLESAAGQLSELCREAGVDSIDELPEIEEKSSLKRQVVQSLANAQQKLVLIADGDPLEQFATEVESSDPSKLDAEILELESTLETCQQQWSDSLESVGALRKELTSIDGGDRAAELNQEIQFLAGRIERESQRYAQLRIASMILQRAIEHYRNENESPVLKLACQTFEELTCGRYTGLKPEYDDKGRSKLFGLEKVDGEAESCENLVPVDAMSLGTADALYLALRLASLEHQLSAGHAIPVVIDDCLIQLDDDRTVAAMKRLSQLSERTQVILFTHHQHLIDLAESSMESGDFHLHRLVG